MTKSFYPILATLVWFAFVVPSYGQSTCSTPIQIAGFGVDGDVNANTPSTVMGDSWFSSPLYPGTGVGVISSSSGTAVPAMSASQFNTMIQSGVTAQDRNRTYFQRMAYPYLTSINGNKLIDAFAARDNISPDTTSFAGSNKNGDNPSLWTIATSLVPNKNDIIDVAGHLRRRGVDNKLWMFANVTKLGTSGDSYTDIEIYRQVPVMNLSTGNLSNTGPASTGGHSSFVFYNNGSIQSAGDILVCLNYNSTNGIASVKIWCDINNLDGNGNGWTWFNALPARPFNFSGDFITGSATNGYGYAEITSLSPASCLVYSVLNTTSSPAGYWGNLSGSGATYSTSLDPEQMVNIAINFSDFGLDLATITGPCSNIFGALMFKTRSSSSFSSELKDICGPFTFGNFSEIQANAGPDTMLTCSNTSIALSGSSITTGATFSWTALSGNIVSGANTSSPIVDQPGTYLLSVQSPLISTCIARDTVVVSLNTVAPTANAGSDVSITCAAPSAVLSGTSNISNAIFIWSTTNGATIISGANSNAPVVGAGCFILTTTNPANGCASSDTVCVTAATQAPVVSVAATSNASCFASCNGSATVSASGSFGPFDFSWSNGANAQSVSNLCAGNYIVTVTGTNGCTAIANVTIQQPTASISISNAAIQDVSCIGVIDGSITVTATGGTAPYSYIWSNGSTGSSSGPVSAGSYVVTVTDANGCSITTSSYLVDEPVQSLAVSNATITNASCFGDANGGIDLDVTGGTAPYSYSWSSGASNQDLNGVSSGNYTVTVTDDNGCIFNASYNVGQPSASLTSSTTVDQNISCFGGQNGSATVTPAGGTSPYAYLWSNGATTSSVSGLTSNSYSVIITDVNGCTTTGSIQMAQPAQPLTASTNVINQVACNGGASGSASVAANGGTSPYSYVWSNGSSAATITSLSQGTFSVTVSDANGCVTNATVFVSEPAAPLSLASFNNVSVSCYGGVDGQIDLTITGGTAPYAYLWSNGSVAASQSGLSNGNYAVTVTDANGCTINTVFNINQPSSPLSVNANTFTSVGCNGGSDGSIDITASGGTAPYLFSWSNGVTSEDVAGLSAGNYSCVITDVNGCTQQISQIITEPSASLSNAVTVSQQVNCFAGNDGSIDLEVNGGTAPYTYAWSNGSSNQDLSGLSSGTYSVTITDANGCQDAAQVTVSQPQASLALSSNQSVPVSCTGGANGSIDLNVLGGTAPYNYSWSNGSSNEDLSGLSAGTYSVLVSDANGCSDSLTVTISQPQASLAVNANTVSNVDCFGNASGSIDLNVGGGTQPYNYQWSNGSASEDLTGIAAGIYTVSVVDANGCDGTITVTISEPFSALGNTVTVSQQVNCFAGNDGSIDLEVNGGTAPYTYAWSNGATNQDLSGLSSGTYSVTITDANGCQDAAQVTVSQPQASLALSSNQSVPVSCTGGANGSIDLNVLGGTAPYNYSWSNGSSNEDLSGLSAGTYSVLVSDANGCSDSLTVTISQPQASLAVNANTVSNVDCFGNASGSIDLNVGGGTQPYSYQWSNGSASEDLTGIAAGTYTASVVDVNGCNGTITVTITEPFSALSNTISVSQQVNCFAGNDGSIDLEVNGGTAPYTYAWSNGSANQDLSGLSAGTYNVLIVDANGCQDSASIAVLQPLDSLSASLTSSQQVGCFGATTGDIDVTTTGGTAPYGFSWSNGSITEDLTGIPAGTYDLSIVDANGCVTNLSATISQPTDSLSIQSVTAQDILCFGDSTGSIDLTPFGGTAPYVYTWSNGASTEDVSSLLTGNYTVTITDANGCTTSQSFQVSQPLAQLSVNGSTSVADCINNIGADINVSTNGGTAPYTYLWSTGATTQNINNLPSATYTVTVSDANGCTAITDFVISNNSFLLVQISSEEICVGDSAVLTVTVAVPATYQWYFNNAPIVGAINNTFVTYAQGFYKCEVNSVCGIIMSDSVEVAVRSLSGASISSNQIICPPETVELVAAGGTTYQWTPAVYISDPNSSNPIVNPRETTIYTVEVTDDFGCKTTMSVEVTVLCDTMLIPTGFSPNGDGVNDGYEIEGIENYPGNILYIYNRWGNLIYKAKDYKNNWTGESNVSGVNYGKKVPSGTYYYILDLNDGQKPRNGYIILRK